MSAKTDGFGFGIAPRIWGQEAIKVTVDGVHYRTVHYTGMDRQAQDGKDKGSNGFHIIGFLSCFTDFPFKGFRPAINLASNALLNKWLSCRQVRSGFCRRPLMVAP